MQNGRDHAHLCAPWLMLNSFINVVNNYVGSGLLTPAQGQNLITKANAAIASIQG